MDQKNLMSLQGNQGYVVTGNYTAVYFVTLGEKNDLFSIPSKNRKMKDIGTKTQSNI